MKAPEIAPAALAPVALAPAALQDTASTAVGGDQHGLGSTAVVGEHAAKVQEPDQCYATVQDEIKNPESEIYSRRSALSETCVRDQQAKTLHRLCLRILIARPAFQKRRYLRCCDNESHLHR